jgi:hypothetical protein
MVAFRIANYPTEPQAVTMRICGVSRSTLARVVSARHASVSGDTKREKTPLDLASAALGRLANKAVFDGIKARALAKVLGLGTDQAEGWRDWLRDTAHLLNATADELGRK